MSFFSENFRKSFIEKIKMSENSKNEVEFREKVYFSDPNLAREARREKLATQQKPNKKHCEVDRPQKIGADGVTKEARRQREAYMERLVK